MRICFVRFGHRGEPFHPEETSVNALTQRLEAGVSVYEALERDGHYQIILPRIDPQTIATLGVCFNVAQGLWGQRNHPLYEVEGDVVGKGSDGEPLLRNVKVVRKVFERVHPC